MHVRMGPGSVGASRGAIPRSVQHKGKRVRRQVSAARFQSIASKPMFTLIWLPQGCRSMGTHDGIHNDSWHGVDIHLWLAMGIYET